MEKIISKIKAFFNNVIRELVTWSSIRMTYLLMSVVLLIGLLFQLWGVIAFVVIMLQVGAWTKFCPSKWAFEKLGWKKTEL